MSINAYKKHFIPLESNPEVFTQLMHDLGISSDLSFQDVLTLNEPALFPRPALALILVFPTSETYDAQKLKEAEAFKDSLDDAVSNDDILWFRQTINNACGLYAILHAVCNGMARNFIRPGSLLEDLLNIALVSSSRLKTEHWLESSAQLESFYEAAAMKGDTSAPANAEDNVDFHYVCFVNSSKTARVYELDGDQMCPINTNILLDSKQDLLSDAAVIDVIQAYINQKKENGHEFSLMALVCSGKQQSNQNWDTTQTPRE